MNEQQKKLTAQFLSGFGVPKKQHEPLTRTIQAEAQQVSLINMQKFLIAASEVLQTKHNFTHDQALEFITDVTAVFVATEKQVQESDN